jgi:hypothetical protein
LFYYIFEWGDDIKQGIVALGYVSMYNHTSPSNCEYEMDYKKETITIKTIRAIKAGEELTINYSAGFDDWQPACIKSRRRRGRRSRPWSHGPWFNGPKAILLFKKTQTSSHPFFIRIISHANHFSFTQACKILRGHGPGSALGPEVKDADLCLCGDVGGLYHISILYFALQYPVMRVFNPGNVTWCKVDDHALACEGEQTVLAHNFPGRKEVGLHRLKILFHGT